jgi:hypothetical protein
MIKILVINSGIHEKNRIGLTNMLNYLRQQQKIEYKVGSIEEIQNYDVIYNPSECINTSKYPNQKFIFGPHFTPLPNPEQLNLLNANIHNNSIYIQPSEWTAQAWKTRGAEEYLQIKIFPFPVDTNRFSPLPIEQKAQRENVLVYYKHRYPEDFNRLKAFLIEKNLQNARLFDYRQRYNENDYLAYLKTCKYGIILDAHESQGFAIEEALSCDVPLLVWNAQTMNQEVGSSYDPVPCTSISYWDERCGEYFHHYEELEAAFQTFQTKLEQNQYNPRQYILENLSTEKCAERFMDLIAF